MDTGDLRFCNRYAMDKPHPVPPEFTELAQIVMHENNWVMPSTCQESLVLYLNLKNCIEH